MRFPSHLVITVAFVIATGLPSLANAASVSGQGTWETTLQGRDLDGNPATAEAYYDTALNITWLADANYARTSGYDADGYMPWTTANAWAASLNPYGSGISGWRLPTVTDTGNPGCDFAYSGTDCGYNVDTATGEMAYMFYTTLGNLAYADTSGVGPQTGWGLSNSGPFSNLQPGDYYTATEDASDSSSAWYISFGSGNQGVMPKTIYDYAWAVHAGDVGAAVVPVPAAVWLFGSGLVGLIGIAHRKAA